MKFKIFLLIIISFFTSCNQASYYLNPNIVMDNYKNIEIIPFNDAPGYGFSYGGDTFSVNYILINESASILKNCGYNVTIQPKNVLIPNNQLAEYKSKLKNTLFCLLDINDSRNKNREIDNSKIFSQESIFSVILFDINKNIIYSSSSSLDMTNVKSRTGSYALTDISFSYKKSIKSLFEGFVKNNGNN